MQRTPLLVALMAGALLVPLLDAAPASAEPSATELARSLANEGADLLESGHYAEALERVTRAEGLYHAPTNMLLIGQAQEGLHKLAAAADTYERLTAEPLPRSAPPPFLAAQETAKQRLSALLARVPSLLVTVQGLDAGVNADVRVDGVPFAYRSSVAVRMDPGPHTVNVTAPSYDPFERSIALPEKGGVVVVDAPLVRATTEARVVPQAPEPPSAAPQPLPATPAQGSLVPAIAAFGVGAVGVGVGAVTGILSLTNVSDLRDRCPGNRCAPSQQSEIDSTKTLGVVSTVGFVVGGVGVAAGAVLLLLRHRSAETAVPRGLALAPWVGGTVRGLEGTF